MCFKRNIDIEFDFYLQEGPQNGSGPTVVHRRRSDRAHQDAQLPALGIQSPQGVFLQIKHLNGFDRTITLNITQYLAVASVLLDLNYN